MMSRLINVFGKLVNNVIKFVKSGRYISQDLININDVCIEFIKYNEYLNINFCDVEIIEAFKGEDFYDEEVFIRITSSNGDFFQFGETDSYYHRVLQKIEEKFDFKHNRWRGMVELSTPASPSIIVFDRKNQLY